MKIIDVKASGHYQVLVGAGLLADTGNYICRIQKPCKVAIISDSNVWPIYGKIVENSLHSKDFSTVSFVFPAGEASKNAATYLEILNFLAVNAITRSDLIVALGGGVVGDITGFAAATFLRGVSYVQIPTSLLAMVDSSVGGKTAIDLPAGKNLVGAFKQPKLVICDISALNTLPRNQFLDGCAEVIKYGVLYDESLLRYLMETGPEFDRELVVTKCIAFKRDAVEADEFDTGARQKLNLGHTIGHGIEVGSNFQITHGHAVAAGMAIVTRAAVSNHMCSFQDYTFLENVLKRFELPTDTEFSLDSLYNSALSDKKRAGTSVNLIIPRSVGCCDIVAIPVSELKSFIKAGL